MVWIMVILSSRDAFLKLQGIKSVEDTRKIRREREFCPGLHVLTNHGSIHNGGYSLESIPLP